MRKKSQSWAQHSELRKSQQYLTENKLQMLNNNQKTDLMNYYNDGLKSIKLTRREVVKTKVNESRIQKLKYQKLKGKDSNSTLEEKDNANPDKVTYPVAS